jgi:hypothetical protein
MYRAFFNKPLVEELDAKADGQLVIRGPQNKLQGSHVSSSWHREQAIPQILYPRRRT